MEAEREGKISKDKQKRIEKKYNNMNRKGKEITKLLRQ